MCVGGLYLDFRGIAGEWSLSSMQNRIWGSVNALCRRVVLHLTISEYPISNADGNWQVQRPSVVPASVGDDHLTCQASLLSLQPRLIYLASHFRKLHVLTPSHPRTLDLPLVHHRNCAFRILSRSETFLKNHHSPAYISCIS